MNIFEILNQYGWKALFVLFLSVSFTILALKIFPKVKLMDRPWKYNLARKPIPYYGGIAIFLAFFISVLLFVHINSQVKGLLIGASIVMVVGFLDDMFSLSPWVRLFAQFGGGIILAYFGVRIYLINMPFIGILDFTKPVIYGVPVLVFAFTVLWVMTITNVMNFLDGVSGLTSSITFIGGLTLFLLSIHPQIHANPASQIGVATIALIISMAALGFLIFDFPPAKILMGDTGSTFLGFVLAALAIFSGGKVATAFLVLGVPILDMIWVVLRRIFSGQKFWKGDLKHLHHRLLDLGFKPRNIVLLYMALSAVFGFTAVMLVSSQQKFFMLIALVILMLVLAGLLVFLPKKKSD